MKILEFTFLLILLSLNSCRSQPVEVEQENAIVLVNTGTYNKRSIAQELEILSRLNAKVIAIDIAFTDYSGDKIDQALIAAIEGAKNVVLPTTIHNSGKDYYGKDMIDVVRTWTLPIIPLAIRNGFVSAEIDDEKDARKIPRKFMIWLKGDGGDIYYHFSVITAMAYDSMKTMKYIDGHPQTVDVDFRARNHDFKIFSGLDLRSGKVTKSDIEGKIVLLGFLGPGDADKFFSPLNTTDGKPDMYGMEYLARIIEQILSYKE